jgi:AcrR family transcriptional regulator
VTAAPRRRRAQRGSGEQLRGEIIAAAKTLLAAGRTADQLTIRAVADAVGVTAPSIYLHFADKQQLLDAVVMDVFGELDQAMVTAAADETTPLGRLCAYGMAYIHFAVDHPEHYRLAMLDPCAEPGIAVSGGFHHLHETVTECFEAGIFTVGEPLGVAFDCWAAAHGVASLLVVKPFVPYGDVDTFAMRVLSSTALGHAAAGVVGGEVTPEHVTEWIARQRRKRR